MKSFIQMLIDNPDLSSMSLTQLISLISSLSFTALFLSVWSLNTSIKSQNYPVLLNDTPGCLPVTHRKWGQGLKIATFLVGFETVCGSARVQKWNQVMTEAAGGVSLQEMTRVWPNKGLPRGESSHFLLYDMQDSRDESCSLYLNICTSFSFLAQGFWALRNPSSASLVSLKPPIICLW